MKLKYKKEIYDYIAVSYVRNFKSFFFLILKFLTFLKIYYCFQIYIRTADILLLRRM